MLPDTWCDFWGGPVQGQVLNFGSLWIPTQDILWFYRTEECPGLLKLNPAEVIIACECGLYGPEYSHSYLTVRHLMLDRLAYFNFMWYVSLWKENLMMYFEKGTWWVNSHLSVCRVILVALFFSKPQHTVFGFFNSWLCHEKLDCLVLGLSLSILWNSMEQNLNPNTSCLAQMLWHTNGNLFSVNISAWNAVA